LGEEGDDAVIGEQGNDRVQGGQDDDLLRGDGVEANFAGPTRSAGVMAMTTCSARGVPTGCPAIAASIS
jgi:hypothetical protein